LIEKFTNQFSYSTNKGSVKVRYNW